RNTAPNEKHLEHVCGALLRDTKVRVANSLGIEFRKDLSLHDGLTFLANTQPRDLVHRQATFIVQLAGPVARSPVDIATLLFGGRRALECATRRSSTAIH
ncbi:hypothetical protein, partial [Corallococcus praedator]|uniref:hypothetical protein n=1 Tax=Corallococcus praedator TaxID=2316724 RepID=UPI001ABF9CED